ncbi:MAG: UDP-N-acetylglucosamine 1-carboxyvinyltransferase [Phycisphaerae bacterium]|nr:MAG: UDP-N-acetylglucosamine 1-carboxyvinyltransferase [Phycisphaerae bacterium]
MDTFVIEGGRRLFGRLQINGSKNAALPLLAATLLTDQPVTLRDVPALADVRNMLRLLLELGCERHDTTDDPTVIGTGIVTLQAADPSKSHARYDIVKTMRASICTLGPMLAKRGHARVSMPGGCAIGDRPVDIHLRGLTALGAQISLQAGDIIAKAPSGGLRGATIFLGGPFGSTVLGTANVMSAAALAHGTTIIECAACEPEIVDLANLLNAMGADITGAGSPRITIHGVPELRGADWTVIPDRIEAGTFMMAAAITNGDLTLDNCPLDALLSTVFTLQQAGVHVTPVADVPATGSGSRPRTPSLSITSGTSYPRGNGADPMRRTVRITCDRVLRPVEVTTQPHPGFPTDLQAQLVALLSLTDGNSVVTERIFPDRFLHVAELLRMGAHILRQGPSVMITGVRKLVGAPVMASDLRASAGLVLAGLAAHGTTVINRVYHLDRGYERMEERLRSLGASIDRKAEREVAEATAVA